MKKVFNILIIFVFLWLFLSGGEKVLGICKRESCGFTTTLPAYTEWSCQTYYDPTDPLDPMKNRCVSARVTDTVATCMHDVETNPGDCDGTGADLIHCKAGTLYASSCGLNSDGNCYFYMSSIEKTCCTATNGVCGTADGDTNYCTFPSTAAERCASGTYVQTDSSGYNWDCVGSCGGTTDHCSAPRETCTTSTSCRSRGGTCGNYKPHVAGIGSTILNLCPCRESICVCGIPCEQSAVQNGVCGALNTCVSGTVSGVGETRVVAGVGIYGLWTCNGIDGVNSSCNTIVASDVNCSALSCAAVNGENNGCLNTVNSCINPSIPATNMHQDEISYYWDCLGTDGTCGGSAGTSQTGCTAQIEQEAWFQSQNGGVLAKGSVINWVPASCTASNCATAYTTNGIVAGLGSINKSNYDRSNNFLTKNLVPTP